jgi:membrane-bound lytic murein transglycosylase F
MFKAQWIVLFVGLLLYSQTAFSEVFKTVSHRTWTNQYDDLYRKYSKRYFGPQIDWKWFKAQGIAESRLKVRAKSRVGAIGLMQIMPKTYAEIKSKNPFLKSIHTPKWNIAAALYYDKKLFKRWDYGFSIEERLSFTFASYNAGYWGIKKAFNKANAKIGEIDFWDEVKLYAPKETRHYVKKIMRLMEKD